MTFLQQALLYLTATVVAVTLFKRLGLGSVLGYMAAGLVIGPSGANLVGDVEAVMHFGELGVNFLLFILGLELQVDRLWDMRRHVFGLGGAQVVLTAAVLTGLALPFGLSPQAAVVVGLGLSLSSTAFALQLLGERNKLGAPHGRASFAVLLFQDLAVIALLASLPLLTGNLDPRASTLLPTLGKTAVTLALIVASRHLLRPALQFIAAQHMHELFTAASLLVVIAISQAVEAIGLSMAFGAFLAGMLFADSKYRHALEADIEPFKGLLLGLFFMGVGMSVNLASVARQPLVVAGLVAGLLLIKGLVLYVLGRRTLGSRSEAWQLAITIGQGGEFAFVIFGQAVSRQILDQPLADLMVAVVTFSMVATPLVLAAFERFLLPRLLRAPGAERSYDVAPTEDAPVLIAGFGRVGQVVGRILRAMGIPFTALDTNPEHIDFIRRFGSKVFYGDAARVDVLRAARADKAKIFVLAVGNIEASLRCAETIQTHFPHLTLIARARNRDHAYRLLRLGVDHVIRETFHSSLVLTGKVLDGMGLSFSESQAAITRFEEHDDALVVRSAELYGDTQAIAEVSKAARKELQSLFEGDARVAKARGVAAELAAAEALREGDAPPKADA